MWLKFYDIRGHLVRTLHVGPLTEGRHELVWHGDDDTGRALASGVYLYEVKAGGEARIGKLTLVRSGRGQHDTCRAGRKWRETCPG